MLNPEIQLTADGSHTLFIPEMDEHYHSVNGAIQESMHVFIQAGLNQCPKNRINVLELGLGTGLNAFLTCIEAEKNQKEIHYTGLEKYPLSWELVRRLNYPEILEDKESKFYQQIHSCGWGRSEALSPHFIIEKVETDFSDFNYPGPYDVVYYDAFAPDKQTLVWSLGIFNRIYESMSPGGVLTTYCAKGNVRRMMIQAGFTVERIPGPPGKRQMLRAYKLAV